MCSDGTVPTGMWVIYNEDPIGGEFYVVDGVKQDGRLNDNHLGRLVGMIVVG